MYTTRVLTRGPDGYEISAWCKETNINVVFLSSIPINNPFTFQTQWWIEWEIENEKERTMFILRWGNNKV